MRADPHLYNTPDDVMRLVDGLDEFIGQEGKDAVLGTDS